MVCYVMLCYVMLCYVMLCYVMYVFYVPIKITAAIRLETRGITELCVGMNGQLVHGRETSAFAPIICVHVKH